MILKINQTIGFFLIVAGFAWSFYRFSTNDESVIGAFSIPLMLLGLIWYGISRFLIWFRKD